MEVLSRILRKTKESDLIRDFQEGAVNSVGVHISHFLFVRFSLVVKAFPLIRMKNSVYFSIRISQDAGTTLCLSYKD